MKHPPHDAQDLTQEFFARLLEKNWLATADRGQGKLRSFLLTAMKRFLANAWDHSQAAKRGGLHAITSMDTGEGEQLLASVATLPEEAGFDRTWALTVLQATLHRLRAEYEQAGKLREYERVVEGSYDVARTVSKAASVLPTRPGGGNTLPSARDVALQQFEENLTALIEARKQALLQTPAGGAPPAALTEEIARLEARDPVAARAAAVWFRQSRSAQVNASRTTRAAALQQFEENLTALLEARKEAFLQTPDGGSPPATLAAEITRLEARDRELRELIRSSGSPPVRNSAPPRDIPPAR